MKLVGGGYVINKAYLSNLVREEVGKTIDPVDLTPPINVKFFALLYNKIR